MLDDHGSTGVREALAMNLRRSRIARHLSLSELARTAGMSKATLSGIENGHANPTIETLVSLAMALRVSVPELLEESSGDVVRISRSGQASFSDRDGLAHRPLESAASAELVEIVLEPRQSLERTPAPQGTRACVYVLDGPLIAGPVERSTELAAGDCISFPADHPYLYATGRSAGRALQLLVSA